MRLAKAIFFRLLYGIASLIFITLVTFIADEITPGDAATVRLGEKATPQMLARERERLGLNRPGTVRYVEWLGKTVQLDLGRSYYQTKEPVIDIVKRSLPVTIKVAISAILLASLIGITLGTFAAIYRNRLLDRSILVISTLGVTLPNFVLAPIFVLIFVLGMDLLPSSWEVPLRAPEPYYLALPVVILAARPMAMLTRLTRASMIDTMQQEFIKLAIAKGVPTNRLIIRHGLRNAILPVITAIGTSFGFLLTGSFVIETYFSLPGMGRETIEAILQGNMPVLQAMILLTGFMFVMLNLIVDILLPILDPRIREAKV